MPLIILLCCLQAERVSGTDTSIIRRSRTPDDGHSSAFDSEVTESDNCSWCLVIS